MYILNVLIVCSLFIFCKSDFVSSLKKCSIKDDKCLNDLHQLVLHEISRSGVPELRIPASDPLVIKNVTVTILDSIAVHINDGIIEGLKNCKFLNFHANLDKKTGSVDLICDFIVKGRIAFDGTNPLLQNLLGQTEIKGDGIGKITLDKLHLDLTFAFYPVKRDGVIYLHWPSHEMNYNYDVENVLYDIQNIRLGKDDIGPLMSPYLTTSGKSLVLVFGKKFIDQAMLQYFKFAEQFFNTVPASKLIIEDLSSYAL